jgi:uncharacterized protein YicC (UPF0701 family)
MTGTMGKRWHFIFFLMIFPLLAVSQVKNTGKAEMKDSVLVPADSTLHFDMKPVYIFPDKKDMSPRKLRQLSSLEMKVKKVYPIAKVAAVKLEEYNRVYTSFKTNRERKDYVKGVEKQLFAEFEDDLRKMKVSEGRILIKLLDRETGDSSFEIIKEFKGGFSAFFWQSVARLFGHDLKAEYDPVNEDRMIEYIISEIDFGLI